MSNIDALANKTERKAIRFAKSSKTSSHSDNQPKHRRTDQLVESNCNCKIVWFESIDNRFYLDHAHTNLIHTGHSYTQPSSTLRGINFISEQSQVVMGKMSAIGVKPSQLALMLHLLEETDGHFQNEGGVFLCFFCSFASACKKRSRKTVWNTTSK